MAGLTPAQRESLFHSGQYSDFRITCRGSEFPVHKIIICTASDYMRVVCESDFKERGEGKLNLPEDDPAAVETVLRYLYTGKYYIKPHRYNNYDKPLVPLLDEMTNDISVDGSEKSPVLEAESPGALLGTDSRLAKLKAHLLVGQCADKFHIDVIKELASENFCSQLDNQCIEHKDFVDLASLVYDLTAAGDALRIKFTEFCLANIDKIQQDAKLSTAVKVHEPVAFAVGKALSDKLAQTRQQDAEKDALIKEKDTKIKQLEKRVSSISGCGSPKGHNGFGARGVEEGWRLDHPKGLSQARRYMGSVPQFALISNLERERAVRSH